MTISEDLVHIPLPDAIHLTQPFVFLLSWVAGIFLLALVLKLANKGPHLRGGIVAGLSILVMYVACLLILKHEPLGLQNYIAPLPFISVEEGQLSLVLYELGQDGHVDFLNFTNQIACMFLLAFIVNQIYFYKPGNLKSPGWLVLRFFSTFFCIGVHYALTRVMGKIVGHIPVDSLLEAALPYLLIAALGAILCTFIIGLLKFSMKYFFKLVNPTFEGLCGFYYTNKFGVVVTRAIYTTLLLTIFAYRLQELWEDVHEVASVPVELLIGEEGLWGLVTLFLLWLVVGFML